MERANEHPEVLLAPAGRLAVRRWSRAPLVAFLALFLARPAAPADWKWQGTLVSRVEYYRPDDLTGQSYTPFYQRLELSGQVGRHLRFYTHALTQRDLETDEGFDGNVYSAFVDVTGSSVLRRLRVGRFFQTGGVGLRALDGGELQLRLHRSLEAEIYGGRETVFRDTRFTGTLLRKSAFTDTGLALGGSATLTPANSTHLHLGYSVFDAGTAAGRQSWVSFGLSSSLPGRLDVDLRGHEDLSADSGRELHGSVRHTLVGGSSLFATVDSITPDRLNPDVVTSIFAADQVTWLSAGARWSVTDHTALWASFERHAFELPGEIGETRPSYAGRLGLDLNYWTARGLDLKLYYRHLSGDTGDLHQGFAALEKRLTEVITLGLRADLVWYRREHEAGHTAAVVSGRLKVNLRKELWFACQVEEYRNLNFDSNLRARLELGLRLSGEDHHVE